MPAQTTAVAHKTVVDEAFALAPAHLRRVMGSPEVADRFLIVALNQFRKVPQLMTCSKESIIDALVRMARLRLDPSIPGEVYLVPFKGQASLIVGYGGLRKLVLRTAEVLDVFASVVCQNDLYVPADSPITLLTHRLPDGFHPRGRAIGYYAAAYLRSGFWRTVAMSRAEVAAHRDRYSANPTSTFWADTHADKEGLTNFDKMAMKTVLRQLCSPRYLSLDADVSEALLTEEALLQPQYEPDGARHVPRLSGPVALSTLSDELYGPDMGGSTPAPPVAPAPRKRAPVAQTREEEPPAPPEPTDEDQEPRDPEAGWVDSDRNLFDEEEAIERSQHGRQG